MINLVIHIDNTALRGLASKRSCCAASAERLEQRPQQALSCCPLYCSCRRSPAPNVAPEHARAGVDVAAQSPRCQCHLFPRSCHPRRVVVTLAFVGGWACVLGAATRAGGLAPVPPFAAGSRTWMLWHIVADAVWRKLLPHYTRVWPGAGARARDGAVCCGEEVGVLMTQHVHVSVEVVS
jgi:hypothetical protein